MWPTLRHSRLIVDQICVSSSQLSQVIGEMVLLRPAKVLQLQQEGLKTWGSKAYTKKYVGTEGQALGTISVSWVR